MLLRELVSTSQAVGASPARLAKITLISDLLTGAALDEVPVVVAFLSGELRQRQIGVGYAALADLPRAPAGAGPPVTVTEADAVFAAVGGVAGAGARSARRRLLAGLFGRATSAEREFLTRLLAGDLHQGALEGVMTEAVARSAGAPAGEVRRALMLGGSLPAVAQAALAGARTGGGPGPQAGGAGEPGSTAAVAALRSFRLRVGRPLRPMLASPVASVAAALRRLPPHPALEWKIDGIRIQVHRDGSRVWVFTRTLDDITARVPEIAETVLGLGAGALVLDGEAVALGPGGRPRPFQVTAGRTGSHLDVARQREQVPLTPFFFDLLHLDGEDLIGAPAATRHARMARIVPPGLLIPRLVTGDPGAAGEFLAGALARGHEGVVVKSTRAPYAAGRRGGEWLKVKPRHTLDLVVLAAEWGHGRRRGWLSNLHLGARDPRTGGLVMLGKTFKGLTDEMLRWQTARLLELAGPPGSGPPGSGPPGGPREARGVLRVRPDLVVEVAFDGVQASPRYPGGLALRFARVLRHRPDKAAADADTIDTVRALWTGAPRPAAGSGAGTPGGTPESGG